AWGWGFLPSDRLLEVERVHLGAYQTRQEWLPRTLTQGIRLSVFWRIGHGNRRTIEQVNATTLPEPLCLGPSIQLLSHQTCHGGEERFGQTLSGPAIGTRFRAARFQPLRDAMRDQSRHRSTAGVIGAEDLPQEDPERHQRRVDTVVPTKLDLFEDLCEALRRE